MARADQRLRRYRQRHFPQAQTKFPMGMELLDESRRPVFRIRLVAESLEKALAAKATTEPHKKKRAEIEHERSRREPS